MATRKKSRTPPPPRRVQAPKTRTSTTRGAPDDARNRMILYAIAGSGIVALVVVVAVIALAGGGSNTSAKDAVAALKKAGWTFKTYPAQPRTPHYTTLPPKHPLKYNSFPPTSGRHYYQWVIWGIYSEPVNLYQEVHNLEHGGMIIQYGNKVPETDIRKIEAFYQDDPNAMLVAPLPKLGDKIALTAWTHLAEGKHFNENAFKAFRSAFRYHGPESPLLTKSQLNPGQ